MNSYHKSIKSTTYLENKLYQQGSIRRKSCYCSECGSHSKFQFQNMNVPQPQHKIQYINRKTTYSLTIPKQEFQFRRKSGSRATDKKKTITDAATTGENTDDQKAFTFQQSSIRTSILSKIETKKLKKICQPMQLLPLSCKHIKLLPQISSSRIKTENFSFHKAKSPQQKSARFNFTASPYFYTFRKINVTHQSLIKKHDQINIKK